MCAPGRTTVVRPRFQCSAPCSTHAPVSPVRSTTPFAGYVFGWPTTFDGRCVERPTQVSSTTTISSAIMGLAPSSCWGYSMGLLVGLAVIGSLPALLGASAVHSYRRYRAARRLQAAGAETTGLCTSLSWHEDDVSVHFSYTLPDGGKHSADSVAVRHLEVSPGDSVRVVYDPDSPSTAELASHLDLAVRIHRRILVFVVPFGIVSAGVFLALVVATIVA
ncbi:DUF3592 domain-containing protein [Streptomyces sp. NPDC005890]|uniref:DUF3592 domain-containing protein n=1 Tax=Streptomyces sp. NPDC005890 TaxID=3154568 RepID=UPI0033D95268